MKTKIPYQKPIITFFGVPENTLPPILLGIPIVVAKVSAHPLRKVQYLQEGKRNDI